jgi:hypothetical protein
MVGEMRLPPQPGAKLGVGAQRRASAGLLGVLTGYCCWLK